MKIDQFDPPGNIDDFGNDNILKRKWSAKISDYFDRGVASVNRQYASFGNDKSQFYNPVTHGRTEPDVPLALGDVPWNGFPKKFRPSNHPTDYAGAESRANQDEYLEWHVTRNAGKIVSVQFTCEGWDYFDFLGTNAPDILVRLYQKFISPNVKKAELFSGTRYNRFNRWNSTDGAMHLSVNANNLGAEVQLAADATVRRQNPAGGEYNDAVALTICSGFGDEQRISDPSIGFKVNNLARDGRMITLANPVGLYMDQLDGAGFKLPDGTPADGFFRILRGKPGQVMRAVYELPPNLAVQGLTVSDVSIGGKKIEFGGHIAEKITMKLTGVASQSKAVHNPLLACRNLVPENLESGAVLSHRMPTRRS